MTYAVKFKDWNIPRGNRNDPFVIPFKSSQFVPYKSDGAINLYGRTRKPLAPKTHTTSSVFTIKRSCRADLEASIDDMMTNLLSGPGRLWFSDPTVTAPLLFYDNVHPQEISWTPGKDNFTEAVVSIDWEITNPILYRPLTAGYLTGTGYSPVVVGASTFGESWTERTFASFTISASPTNITINNIGHTRTHRIILRLESLGINGFVTPKIENTTTSQFFKFNGTGLTINSFLQANCAISRVRTSSDAGLSFVNTPNDNVVWSPGVEIGDLQWPIMEFAPGANNLIVTASGTPNFRLMILWQPAFGMAG
jgi:hypothetical protein